VVDDLQFKPGLRVRPHAEGIGQKTIWHSFWFGQARQVFPYQPSRQNSFNFHPFHCHFARRVVGSRPKRGETDKKHKGCSFDVPIPAKLCEQSRLWLAQVVGIFQRDRKTGF